MFVLGCALGGDAATVQALPHWKPRPSGPTTAYAPQMRHYIVVSPTPAIGAPVMLPGEAAGPGDSAIFAGSEADLAAAPRRHRSLHGRVKQALSPAHPPDQVLWQQQVEPIPAYPWGWFGARRHTENFGHRRQLGGEYDWALGRGD
jgi:hypothetical protein